MRISISNIAWDVTEDDAVAQLLRQHSVDAIDIAPGKYFAQPQQASREDVAKVRDWWEKRGIQIVGMQALLFGTAGLNMFGSPEVKNEMLAHLKAICSIGGQLGAAKLVFGSPKNRDRALLNDAETSRQAIRFFRDLGDIARAHGVVVCLEPNPPCYGANFMTTSDETALIVEAVSHPGIKMQLDTGAITINGESPGDVVARHAHLIGHIHLSEPDLLPLGDSSTDHRALAHAIHRALPQRTATIEMIATKEEPHLAAIERALSTAIIHYRTDEGAKR